MKFNTSLFLSLFFLGLSIVSNGQPPKAQVRLVNAHEWSNESVYNNSPKPIIKNYGELSDSLSGVYGGDFFVHNSAYYRISTWADYYLWFTKQYSTFFSLPGLYEYYYYSDDNIGMASYIASHRYLGKYYPSMILITFDGGFLNNRLESTRYIVTNEKKKNSLENSLRNNRHYVSSVRKQYSTIDDEYYAKKMTESSNSGVVSKVQIRKPQIIQKDKIIE
jgi:hypothetical protein